MSRKWEQLAELIVLLCVIWPNAGQAQVLNRLSIHGFGSWAYGRTNNENRYLMGTEEGSYEYVNLSLNIGARPYDNVFIALQPAFKETIFEDAVTLDYAFAEWFIADALAFRAGKVKAPFMLATEVYDVGTLRPFFSLPQGAYHEMAAEAYKGVGLTGLTSFKTDWEVRYDLYGGTMDLQTNPIFTPEHQEFVLYTPVFHDMLGGRLMLHPPITGLHLGVSSYIGDVKIQMDDHIQDDHPLNDQYHVIGTSAEYVTERWWLRSEYLTLRKISKIEVDVMAFEAAYMLTQHWQVAGRYEFLDANVKVEEQQPASASQLEHEEIALGLNYWINPHLAVKCSYHVVEGNRFAFPNDFSQYLANLHDRQFEEETQLLLIGVQFSF